MTVFADASAVVPLYVDEPGRDALAGQDTLVVSALTYVEVPAALWRKHRVGDLTARDARTLVDEFLASWTRDKETGTGPGFLPVRTSPAVLHSAVRLCGVHGLRAYDGVQLASAMAAREAEPEVNDFAGYDTALNEAAAAEGFLVNNLP